VKQGRSRQFTSGIVNTLDRNLDSRFPFFETDDPKGWEVIDEYYRMKQIDYYRHRTGKGWHWLSPVVMTKQEWSAFHSALKHINPDCPMITLRVEPNKYPYEDEIWKVGQAFYCQPPQRLSASMCAWLNGEFGTFFKGDVKGTLQYVRYPLPEPITP
jgi:hypothetical protein